MLFDLILQLTVESQGLLEMELLSITLVRWRDQLYSTSAILDLVHRVYYQLCAQQMGAGSLTQLV